jgi:RNA polymerase-interacting CarD/CdnL/TRCF family regulator
MPADTAPSGAKRRIHASRRASQPDCAFGVGDELVHAQHGVGTVVERSVREFDGAAREYLTFELQRGSLTLRIPTDALGGVRLRAVSSAAEARRGLDTLEAAPEPLPSGWTKRRDDALRKIGLGELDRLAEVVRDFAHLGGTKRLATSEREIYGRARDLLEMELVAALGLDGPSAAKQIDRRIPTLRY